MERAHVHETEIARALRAVRARLPRTTVLYCRNVSSLRSAVGSKIESKVYSMSTAHLKRKITIEPIISFSRTEHLTLFSTPVIDLYFRYTLVPGDSAVLSREKQYGTGSSKRGIMTRLDLQTGPPSRPQGRLGPSQPPQRRGR